MNWNEIKNEVYDEISNAILSAVAYEPSNSETWAKAIEAVGKIVQPLEDNGTLADYQIICDEETNDEETRNMNMFVLKFGWKEHEGDEWTICDFTLSPKGFDISDGGAGTSAS